MLLSSDFAIRFSGALLLVLAWSGLPLMADEPDPQEVFATRIMPIFKSPNPSSCIQCHLASVDLKDYILPSHEETFLSLRDQGLINVKDPDASKILELIGMGERDTDRGARMIHAKVREQEYEAFRNWIQACVKDRELMARQAGENSPQVGPDVADEVIRHGRKDRVLDSFVRNVWSQRMRCFPCHTPGDLDRDNPQHQKPIQRYQELLKQYGAKINLFKDSPEQSMNSMLTAARNHHRDELPVINLADPEQSLLLLKPMAKLPAKSEEGTFLPASSQVPVSHLGGLKIHKHDHSYKAILQWIEDVAAIESESYAVPEDLPADPWRATNRFVRISQTPEDWRPGMVVQIMIFEVDQITDMPSQKPVAFTQGIVTPRHFVNGPLFLDRNRNDLMKNEGAEPSKKYQLRVYPDFDGAIELAPTSLLGPTMSVGEVEFEFPTMPGFPHAAIIEFSSIKPLRTESK